MAKREQKPVFINNDMFGGTFRRDHSGDYHCTRLQVKSMLRDQTDNTMDMEVLDDTDYLRSIGAAAISDVDKKLHPTAAGMLMFGNVYVPFGQVHTNLLFHKKKPLFPVAFPNILYSAYSIINLPNKNSYYYGLNIIKYPGNKQAL